MSKFLMLFLGLFATFVTCAASVDPTRPFQYSGHSSAQSSASGKIVLQTIVDHGTKKHVVISGKVLSMGDRYGQYQLTKITENYVVLSSEDKELKLSLFSSVVAKSK